MILFLMLFTYPALAYVGPGPGLTMLSSLWALFAGIFLALFMVVFYPIRLLVKSLKNKKKPNHSDDNS